MRAKMLPYVQFLDRLRACPQNRKLMARMALNAIEGTDAAPVDLAELRHLTPINRSIVTGFLNWVVERRLVGDIDLLKEDRNLLPLRHAISGTPPETNGFERQPVHGFQVDPRLVVVLGFV